MGLSRIVGACGGGGNGESTSTTAAPPAPVQVTTTVPATPATVAVAGTPSPAPHPPHRTRRRVDVNFGLNGAAGIQSEVMQRVNALRAGGVCGSTGCAATVPLA